ncbi:MAG: hypothetical protein ACJAZ2_000816 [Glaciecola sp.]|jgi:hypothetical protein
MLLIFLVVLTPLGSTFAQDTVSVKGYLNNQIISDSTGLLTVLKQSSSLVFDPVYYSQNIGGLRIDLSPKFSLSNWYDDVALSKLEKKSISFSDSSLTEVNYLYGLDASHEFLGSYADKLGKTHLNIIFDRSSSEGRLANTDVKNVKFLINLSKNSGKHRFQYGFVKNSFVQGQNGGIEDSSTAYYEALELTKFTVPVALNSAQNSISMTEMYVGNSYILNYKDIEDSLSIDTINPKYLHALGYSLNLQKEQYLYSMDQADIYSSSFDTTLVNLNETWDSLGYSKLCYEVYYQLLDSVERNIIKLSYGSDVYDWSILNQSFLKLNFQNYMFGHSSINGKYNIDGLWKGGYDFELSHNKDIFTSWLSSFKYQIGRNLPGYFFMNYQGNHFNWSNTFEKIRSHNVTYSLYHKPSFSGVEGSVRMVDNWIYMDTLSLPVQLNERIQYFKVGAFNAFSNKYLSIYTNLSYQKSSSDVLRFPSYNIRNVFSYNFKLGRLNFSTGYIFNYFSSFTGLDYNPNLRRIYLQDEKEVGGIPLLDVFGTVSIGEANVFVKGENILFDSVTRAYFLYANRPVLPRYLRIGFSWTFKN